jgi:hypothetical protein
MSTHNPIYNQNPDGTGLNSVAGALRFKATKLQLSGPHRAPRTSVRNDRQAATDQAVDQVEAGAMATAMAGAMVEVTAIDRLFPSGATSALPLASGLLISEINATVERGARPQAKLNGLDCSRYRFRLDGFRLGRLEGPRLGSYAYDRRPLSPFISPISKGPAPVDLTRSPHSLSMTAICAFLPFIAIGGGPLSTKSEVFPSPRGAMDGARLLAEPPSPACPRGGALKPCVARGCRRSRSDR